MNSAHWHTYLPQLQALQHFTPSECLIFSHYLQLLAFAKTDTLIRQGEEALSMDFLLAGEVRLYRQGIDLGIVKAGNHFGELGLLTGKVRSASIVALSDGYVARLDHAAYQQLATSHPSLTLKLLQALIGNLGHTLAEMTDSLGLLLSERSLPRHTHVAITYAGRTQQVRTGTPIAQVLAPQATPAVAALLNHQAVSLNTQLFSDATLSPLSAGHWEGERIYRRSTALLLLETLSQLYPHSHFYQTLALGGTQWFTADPGLSIAPEDVAQQVQAHMQSAVAKQIRFRSEWWSMEEAMAYFQEQGHPETAELLQIKRSSTVRLVSCGQLYALDVGPLVPDSSYLACFQVHPWENGLVLTTTPLNGAVANLMAPYAQLMAAHQRWVRSLNVNSMGRFNQACIDGKISTTIRVAEGFHEKRLGEIADAIAQRPDCRLICIAGPSSSGKTTFIKRLTIQLQVNGLQPMGLSLDDYYRDRSETPRDENGDYDFEHLEALNLPLLQTHLQALLKGETVATAHYDFHSGTSHPQGGPPLKLDPQSILLLEGIHGLNPALLNGCIPEAQIFRIFVQPLTGLALDPLTRFSTSDMRLLRRIVRDRHTRSTSAAETIARWPSVRAGEQHWIFPFVSEADAVFDTSLIYEVAVLKVYAERYLLEVQRSHPSFLTAYRLREVIDLVVSLYPDQVPPTSILREFIGNSGFEY